MFEPYDQPPTSVCVVCKQELPTTERYWYPRTDRPGNKVRLGKCRDCHRDYQREWKRREEDTPKPKMVYDAPYRYGSKQQRVDVETFLRRTGWKRMEGQGWWKPGVKNKDGTWIGVARFKRDGRLLPDNYADSKPW